MYQMATKFSKWAKKHTNLFFSKSPSKFTQNCIFILKINHPETLIYAVHNIADILNNCAFFQKCANFKIYY
jgi:hypothetical protein